MKKYLINFLILLMLSLNAVSASEKDYGNLTEITLKKGLNEKQAREVAICLGDELTDLFKYWLTESHFIYGTEPNIDFNVDFSAASVDLDNDNNDDLLVRVEHSLVCGVGDCDKIDILLSGDITGIKAGILGGSKYYVSDKTKHGLRYLFFEMDCRTNIDEKYQNIEAQGGDSQLPPPFLPGEQGDSPFAGTNLPSNDNQLPPPFLTGEQEDSPFAGINLPATYEENICDFYMLEPTSSEQYSGAILVQKEKKVE